MKVTEYLIWSIEHDAWWGPKECGYVSDIGDAGIYPAERAKEIVISANRHCTKKPYEALVPLLFTF